MDTKQEKLLKKARELIYSVYPKAVEISWPKQHVVSYGVGPKKMSEHFVYLMTASDHINFGFYYGADLDDPAKLLGGEGKLLRHIRIDEPTQLEDPRIKELIIRAASYLPKLSSDDPRILKTNP